MRTPQTYWNMSCFLNWKPKYLLLLKTDLSPYRYSPMHMWSILWNLSWALSCAQTLTEQGWNIYEFYLHLHAHMIRSNMWGGGSAVCIVWRTVSCLALKWFTASARPKENTTEPSMSWKCHQRNTSDLVSYCFHLFIYLKLTWLYVSW